MDCDEIFETITFSEKDLHFTSFAAFEDMRRKRELCDLTIKVGNDSFLAHRVILAAGIPYFRTVFTSDEREPDSIKISMGEIIPSALESLIQFAYSGKLKISTENVCSLLQASDFLQLFRIREMCEIFLSKRLCVTNVVQVRTLGYNLSIAHLFESSNNYILQNFEEVSKSNDFLSLASRELKMMLANNNLNVTSEEIVLEAVMRWVEDSPSERRVLLADLLKEVRMIYLPVTFLIKTVASMELIRTAPGCRELIDKVKNFHLLPKEESAFLNLKTSPRNSYTKVKTVSGKIVPKKTPRKFISQDGIYAICLCGSLGYSVYYCDKLWRQLVPPKDVGNDYICNVTSVNRDIYVFFGKSVQVFHLETLEWEVLGPAARAYNGAAIVTHDSIIYGFGQTVACFNTRLNKWLERQQMLTCRRRCAVATFKESVYITGGCAVARSSYDDGKRLNTVEQYSPSNNELKAMNSMLVPRSSHCCTSMNGKIYVCGGNTTEDFSNSVESYDPCTKKWSCVSSMRVARRFFSLISYNQKIYAVGGIKDTGDYITEAEIYDSKKHKWKSGFYTAEGFRYAILVSAG